MILAGHQPTYLPGIVLFNKIALSDKFMFVGHCDYQAKSWQSHNFIRGADKPLKLSVPCWKGKSINETKPTPDLHWRHKHTRSIELTYRDRPYFNDYYPEIADCIMRPAKNLSHLNIGLIRVLMHMLEIETPTYCSEDFQIAGHKTEMLANMCAALGARHYLSSPGEVDYVDKTLMNGYGHSFQQFTHPVYHQGRGEFVPNLSVIDLLFNCGPQSAKIVREAGTL